MKKIIYILLTGIVFIGLSSCKKFLNVTPIDNLSGNNFWKSENDVEAFTNALYAKLRLKLTSEGNYLNNAADLRCSNATVGNIPNMNAFIANDIRVANLANTTSNSVASTYFRRINNWKDWYDIIQNSNIMVQEVGNMDAGLISETKKKTYVAEAVFLRNLCYFYMVRLYGDIPYYTNAYNEKPLPRLDQVQVMKNAIADLMAVKNDLPVRYEDQSKNGNRAMRGGAIGLLMHMNMWASSFAKDDKKPYYETTIALANELATYTEYSLIKPFTIENNKKLFKGGTSEVLFEIISNTNYGEGIPYRAYSSGMFSHYPFKGNISRTSSNGFFQAAYMQKLFPQGEPDLRRDVWLETYDLGTTAFQLKKYSNTFVTGTDFSIENDDNMVIFRLPDMLLLAAEAANNLSDDATAVNFANIVRDRAGKTPLNSTGTTLAYDIYLERTRELFLEGQYYYDLVRTRRIFPGGSLSEIKPSTTISPADFNNGAWTWSIDAAALDNNPYMTLNNYWR
ncbi:RagB/SusD family nutrient uptake outer membrane protein [Pedobacter heparinus]|uniref:RagB/SusD family nutrient uptake outer membrane protein n=1 Tax=Pedobacter heparinus TaxID=984 RepID=UPI0029315930|nr:RagB/SusD family nutrient uptake outer membrane protein [Pedobacter heparinus]